MEVEFTARQGKISKALREQAVEGMERIGRVLGKTATASLVFDAQRHLQIVELTLKARLQTIVATGKAETLDVALRQAIEHAENQARKHRDRRLEGKRLPKEEKVLTAPPVTRSKKARSAEPETAVEEEKPTRAMARAAIAVHSFPAREAVVEPHVIKSAEVVALKPMTLEEAVKEAEFRDRDLLVFHSPAGDLYILHRRRDGQMELIELP